MIEDIELRKGNLVLNHEGKLSRIVEIHKNTVILNDLTFWQEEAEWGVHCTQLSGIIITPEILTQFGFNVKDDNPKKKPHYEGDVLFNIDDFEFTNSQIDGFKCYQINSGNIIYKYVHQLQNLYFALKHLELKINLTQPA